MIFRFRYLLHMSIYALGLAAPWDRWLHFDQGRTSWLLLASLFGRTGWSAFDRGTIGLLLGGILLSVAGAMLRTWASAYLGASAVQDWRMQVSSMVSSGPYAYVRNPLYLGTMLHTIALALLMPPSGAIFAIVFIVLLQLQLIREEQSFLELKLGPAYLHYCKEVALLLPRFRNPAASSHARPRWGRSILSEIYMWGVAASFLALGWRYNALLIIQGVLVSFGISIVVRAVWQDGVPADSAE